MEEQVSLGESDFPKKRINLKKTSAISFKNFKFSKIFLSLKKNVFIVPFLFLFTIPFLIAIGLLINYSNTKIILENKAADLKVKSKDQLTLQNALTRNNLLWKVYPKAQTRINGNTYSNDSKPNFNKEEVIAFDADLSLQDYRFTESFQLKGGILPDAKLQQDIKSYYWSFGDWSSAEGQKVSHSYSQEGVYPVALLVEHKNGNIDSTSIMVKIGSSKESEIYRGEDFDKYFLLHPEMKAEAKKINGSLSIGKKLEQVKSKPLLTEEPEKVALLVDSDTYQLLSLGQYLIEGKNPIAKYIKDVQGLFPEVELLLINDKNWESWDPINCTPQPSCRPEYDIRNTLKDLYLGTDPRIIDGKGIKGAILVGSLPYFKWFQKLFNESGYNKTVCSQCYEDLDGLYEDRYKMELSSEVSCPGSEYCDGYMDYVDYQPTGAENSGPEIWVSWIKPLIGLSDRNEIQQLKDFFLKSHRYYLGDELFLDKPLLVFNNTSELVVNLIKGPLTLYYKNDIDVIGGIQIPVLSREVWFKQETSRHKYLYVVTHGSPWSISFAKSFNGVYMTDMLNLGDRSLVSVFHACATANFNLTPRENFQLSAVGNLQMGLNSEGTGVVLNWLTNEEEIISAWISGAYYGKAWFEGKRSFLLRNWLSDHRNLPSFLLFGNPFVRFSFQPTPTSVPTLTITMVPTPSLPPNPVCNPSKPSCKPGFSCKCSARGPGEGSKGGCFCEKVNQDLKKVENFQAF